MSISLPDPSPFARAVLSNFVLAEQQRRQEDLFRMMDEVSEAFDLDADDLAWLATQPLSSLQVAVAQHFLTPPSTLHDFAFSRNIGVRVAAVMNAHLPATDLAHIWVEELGWAAQHPDRLNTDPETTARPKDMPEAEWAEATDRSLLRFALADNPKSPPARLTSLALLERDERVLSAIAQSRSATAETLRAVLASSTASHRPLVRLAVAQNLHTDAQTLVTLAADESEEVRRTVAFHPSTPEATQDALMRELR